MLTCWSRCSTLHRAGQGDLGRKLGSGFPLAFRHEAILRRAFEWLAVRSDGLRRACIALTFGNEAVLRSTRKRLTVLSYGFAFACSLRCRGTDCECGHQDRQHQTLHVVLL